MATRSDTQLGACCRLDDGSDDTAEGVEAAIAPIHTDLFRQARVQREAAARQRLERRAVAPVQRKKAARLAGGGTGDVRPLDDDGLVPHGGSGSRRWPPRSPRRRRSILSPQLLLCTIATAGGSDRAGGFS